MFDDTDAINEISVVPAKINGGIPQDPLSRLQRKAS